MTEPAGLVAGVDEAGRGPLAGPVVAAAVILNPTRPITGLADSKRLSAARRERLEVRIKTTALAWAVAEASVEEIEQHNILQATLLAMKRAVESLAARPQHVLIDGPHCPVLSCSSEAVIGGDKTVAAISAASILAKVARDRVMVLLDAHHPGYGFAQHKGYPTKQHLQALRQLGVSPVHRRLFRPVRLLL